MAELRTQRCEVCRPGTPTLPPGEIAELQRELHGGWSVVDGRMLQRDIKFPDFASAMARANQIAGIAEEEGHHPDLRVGWGHLGIDLTTHAAHGLTRNDFILAAKIDALES
ncbi:MAG TPA: 4a-hydroxytetrahydrobiopterin dehydratase [Candidatus Dormibacteraeota bacterium]